MTGRTRAAERVAALEAERFAACRMFGGWSAEEQAEHRAVLMDALSDDPVVVAYRERQADTAQPDARQVS